MSPGLVSVEGNIVGDYLAVLDDVSEFTGYLASVSTAGTVNVDGMTLNQISIVYDP